MLYIFIRRIELPHYYASLKLQCWPRIVNTTALFENSLKLVFQVREKIQNGANVPCYSSLRIQFIQACLPTKRNLLLYFDARLEHMANWPRNYGSYIDWLMQSCDTSPCDLSPERILEKYGRPVKSAVVVFVWIISSLKHKTMSKLDPLWQNFLSPPMEPSDLVLCAIQNIKTSECDKAGDVRRVTASSAKIHMCTKPLA